MTTTSRFCDTCGAALATSAIACPVCGATVAASSTLALSPRATPPPLLSMPAQPIASPIKPGPGSLLAGRYLLVEKVGEGGFGAVYKARDKKRRGKLVAIKQINMAALSAQEKIEATDSYNREIELLSKLKHKSLPRVYDHFTDPEHWYVVMDYIEGRTLDEILAAAPGGRLSLAQTLKIGLELCDVLAYLHRQYPPVIYRDVKPGNIMLTAWGQFYLIDFGIARRYQKGKPRDTTPLGSPGYAAPEQYKAQSTVQSDIYGLGAALQTLLTGKEPLDIKVSGIPPDCQIPGEVQTLINRMLDPDPAKRPKNIDEVRNALKRLGGILTSLPIQMNKWALLSLFCNFLFAISYGIINGFFISQLWLLYLLLIAGIVVARNIYALRRLRSLAFPPLTGRAIFKLISLGIIDSLYYACTLTVSLEGPYILHSFGFSLAVLLRPGVGVILIYWLLTLFLIPAELYRFCRWLRAQSAVWQLRRQQRKQQAPPLQQQQVQKRP
jgi:tRNA A-37 threonylcarbamoyl transferase component Bud32